MRIRHVGPAAALFGLFSLFGCTGQQLPTGFDIPFGGKASGDLFCKVNDLCATQQGLAAAPIAMDAPACAKDVVTVAVADTPVGPTQPVCGATAACFPDYHEGEIDVAFQSWSSDLRGACESMSSVFYWFAGGEKPYVLTAQLERAGVDWGEDIGRGKVRLEVRKYAGGVAVEPRENSTPDRYVDVIYPGEAVALIPVPSQEYYLFGLAERTSFAITFDREEAEPDPNRPDPGPAGKPDLYIKSFEVQPAQASGRVVYTAKVCNRGAGAQVEFDLELYTAADKSPACGAGNADDELAYKGVFWPGDDYCVVQSFEKQVEPGAYSAYVMVDGDCRVDEGDESNNLMGAGYTVGEGVYPPVDAFLTVPEFKAHVVKSTVHFTTRVCNAGLTPSAPLKAKLYYALENTSPSADPRHVWELPGIEPGNSCTEPLTFKLPNLAMGNYQAFLEFEGAAAEQVAPTSFAVTEMPIAPEQPAPEQPAPEQPAPEQPAPEQPAPEQPAPEQPAPEQPAPEQPAPEQPAPEQPAPEQPKPETKSDLYIGDITATPDDEVGLVSFKIQVCNRGKTLSEPFKLALYFDVVEPKCGMKADVIWSFSELRAEDCVVKSARNGRTEGAYTASGLADADCKVDEEAEDNNSKSVDYTVGSSEPEPSQKEDNDPPKAEPEPTPRPTPQTPTPTPQIPTPTVEASGCQIGSGSAGAGVWLLLPLALLWVVRRRRR